MKAYLLVSGLVSGLIIAIALTSCSPSNLSQRKDISTNPLTQLKTTVINRAKVVSGQLIYVPIYSHIYHNNSPDRALNLSATLSIRNTDLNNSIAIASVRYYDTKGKLVRQYINQPVELQPLASTEVFIETDDVAGGAGANFIVEWTAEKKVYAPVVEAIMISTASAQGISFTSTGRVLKQYD
ncbi:DUF3124 domain-containing protein [Pseudanabaena sp. ABRG5-3]|uniref:DUF3124 domain-containing protein n=1 Tax=Pseudanabaena sp. ABRG5-3 TaxID=685565 RepID=UPI000DC6D7D0|nr:DUF3124 domain-containing protein [Pseudanabaena sp. ABRG5-3]BBC23584.1 hypothetical protein ABRG53_1327 [Pseudanabaena sp. ABRG5-3]